MGNKSPLPILIADDDPDDRMMIAEAFEEASLCNPLVFAEDGIDLLEQLRGENGNERANPGLILLDLNMPRMDGRTALEEIRKDADLRRIPVVVLTTSQAEEDILRTYDLGVNSFITKPVTFEGLVKVVQVLNSYWIEIVALPERAA
ncbi:MAG: response regulator [Pseudomonadota bacterium]